MKKEKVLKPGRIVNITQIWPAPGLFLLAHRVFPNSCLVLQLLAEYS